MKLTVGEKTFTAKYATVVQMNGEAELAISYEDRRPMADIVQTWDGNEKITTENKFGDVQEFAGFGIIRRIVRDSDTDVFIGLMEGAAQNG